MKLILILSSHLRLGLPRGMLLQAIRQRFYMHFQSLCVLYA